MFTAFAFLILLFWIFAGIDFILGVCIKIPRLERKSSTLSAHPKISVIFAARNEGSKIAPAIKSLLAQDYPDFEVVIVNDRSTDDTLAVMRSFTDPKLKILNIEQLPEGWLGKNHALYEAYKVSSGRWLLFTDADVIFDPETLKYVAAFGEARKADHLAVLPKMEMHGMLEKIYVVCFGIGFFLYFRPWEAMNPKSKAHLGIGAFNMVRREAYEKIGGHKSFALNILDDMELGRRLKAAGFRPQVIFGAEFLSVRWLEGWQGILKSLEKNGFAGVEYRLGFLTAATLVSMMMNVLPFILIFITSGMVQAFIAAVLLIILSVYIASQRLHPGTLGVFFFHPFGCMLVFAMVWRSALLALREGGVRWRDTFYSLKDLRAK